MSSCYWVFRFVFYVFFKLFNRLQVFNEEKVPTEGGVIVMSNHASYLDPLLIGASLRRRATFMARKGLFKVPLLGSFVSAFSFPVSRTKPLPSTIKEAVKRLKRGELIVMFPQGSRSMSGDLVDMKRGVSVIARLSGADVVPAFIEGTDKALPIGARIPKPSKIRVKFGEPISIAEYSDEDISSRIVKEMKGLKP
ncbi:MAG: 1-acyl-sn-glycerol-3-phosphate acyltransferase [Nitrospirae bacterium]|nr:1-acyl-sn-glycerol-3-phosphate acyltransferase [Nitrospirota bacterium]